MPQYGGRRIVYSTSTLETTVIGYSHQLVNQVLIPGAAIWRHSHYSTQVYLRSHPAADQQRQISNDGGAEPHWKRYGKELYYMSAGGKVMAVDIAEGRSGIEPGIPRTLFDTGLDIEQDGGNHYAATADRGGFAHWRLIVFQKSRIGPFH